MLYSSVSSSESHQCLLRGCFSLSLLAPLGSSAEQGRGLLADKELLGVPLAECPMHSVLYTCLGLCFAPRTISIVQIARGRLLFQDRSSFQAVFLWQYQIGKSTCNRVKVSLSSFFLYQHSCYASMVLYWISQELLDSLQGTTQWFRKNTAGNSLGCWNPESYIISAANHSMV